MLIQINEVELDDKFILRGGIEKQIQGSLLEEIFGYDQSSLIVSQQQSCEKKQLLEQTASKTDIITNGEFLTQQMSNSMIRQSILDKYSKQNPSLKLTITQHDQNDIELDEDDIQSVFEKFGNVEVRLDGNGIAQVDFNDIVSAYFALLALNGLEIENYKITINLEWFHNNVQQQQMNIQSVLFPIINNSQTANNYNSCNNIISNENVLSDVHSSLSNNKTNTQMNKNQQNQIPHLSFHNPRFYDANNIQNNQNMNPIQKEQVLNQNATNLKPSNNQNNQNSKECRNSGIAIQQQNTSNQTQIIGNNIETQNNGITNSNNNFNIQNNINKVSLNPTSFNNNSNSNNIGNQNKSINSMNNNQCTNFSNYNNNLNICSSSSNNIKYTCRYEIQIQNDKDFQVARKIIGSRGENMKAIIKKCMDNKQKKGGYYQNDDDHSVKLRLRGKGSGYKEGPEKQESQEDLHLCVSSMYYNMYKKACLFVEELLQNIYDEYYRMCQLNNLKIERVYIKRQESTNGKGTIASNHNQLSNNSVIYGQNNGGNQNNTNSETQYNPPGANQNILSGINQNNQHFDNQNNIKLNNFKLEDNQQNQTGRNTIQFLNQINSVNQNNTNRVNQNKQNHQYQQVKYIPAKQEIQQQNTQTKLSYNNLNLITDERLKNKSNSYEYSNQNEFTAESPINQ